MAGGTYIGKGRFLQKFRLPSQPLNFPKTLRWCGRSEISLAYVYICMTAYLPAGDLPITPLCFRTYYSYRTGLLKPPPLPLPDLLVDPARGKRSERITEVRLWGTKDTEGPRITLGCMLTAGENKIELGMQSVGLFLHNQQASSHQNIFMIVASLIRLIPQHYCGGDQLKYQRPGIFGGRFFICKSVLVQPRRIAEGIVLIFDEESLCRRQHMLVQSYFSFLRGLFICKYRV